MGRSQETTLTCSSMWRVVDSTQLSLVGCFRLSGVLYSSRGDVMPVLVLVELHSARRLFPFCFLPPTALCFVLEMVIPLRHAAFAVTCAAHVAFDPRRCGEGVQLIASQQLLGKAGRGLSKVHLVVAHL